MPPNNAEGMANGADPDQTALSDLRPRSLVGVCVDNTALDSLSKKLSSFCVFSVAGSIQVF